MPSSPIRKLAPFADAAKKEGVQVYHLNIGQPDIATPIVMLEAVQQANLKVLAYTDSQGILSLRKKLAAYYDSKSIDVNYEYVLITIGGSEAILFAFMACLDEGDEIIVPEPFYANYIGFAMAAGIHIIPITSSITNGFALPPIAMSGFPSPSKSAATRIVADWVGSGISLGNPPFPSLRQTKHGTGLAGLLERFATMMSGRPSPLRSATVM